jgi:hypothetical protein
MGIGSGNGIPALPNAKPTFVNTPPPPPQRPAQTSTRALGTDSAPADLVTSTPVTMSGRAYNASGNAAGRYNLRPRFRGAAALADSPLLGRLLQEWSHVFDAMVLPLLDPVTRALLGRVGQACRDAVLRSPNLPCAGRTAGVKLLVKNFVGTVKLLAWARANGCPWNWRTCTHIVRGGCLVVLQWARARNCPWDEGTCQIRRSGRAP